MSGWEGEGDGRSPSTVCAQEVQGGDEPRQPRPVQVIDADKNCIVIGERYDMTLADIEAWQRRHGDAGLAGNASQGRASDEWPVRLR